ncbi:MAG: HAD family phosphatase [Clostridia bacterium]|nr:HAD family phosphatase [Clostridia bacterium]
MEKLRFPCLVMDHDDTVVNSTAVVHFPAFLDAMRQLRPEMNLSGYTLEDYFRVNFQPGILPYYRKVLGFSDEEMQREYEIWQEHVARTIPRVYPGVADLIRRYTALGGTVCVISHSVDVNIRRDWQAGGLPEPRLIYGWEQPPERRKPAPFPLLDIMERLGFAPKEMLVVDDLKPGYDMARAAGVAFAAALWSHEIPEIRDFMQAKCDHAFTAPEALADWLFLREEGEA